MNTVLNNTCFEKTANITYYDFKILLDHYQSMMGERGLTTVYSLLVIDNRNTMLKIDEKIDKEMHERFDPILKRIGEHHEKLNEIKRKYVDRDAQGNPQQDEHGEPIVTEMQNEYQEELIKLLDEYKDVVSLPDDASLMFDDYLKSHNIQFSIILYNDILKLPDELPPAIVEIYSKIY